MECSNRDRDTKLNVIMDDKDPGNILLKVMSPMYGKCASVEGKSGHLLSSNVGLSRGDRQEHAYAKVHFT